MLLVTFALLTCAPQSTPPNVVILFSDDAGYADFGFQPGCREEMKSLTPRIDSIARDGIRFDQAYMAGSVCSPSRAGLMTGRYPQRFAYDNNLPPGTKSGLDLAETLGAKRLGEIGYTTGLIGKWHLGYPAEYHPNERGFDHFYGLLQGARPYFPKENISAHKVILLDKTPTPEVGYVTDRFGDGAVKFITENKDKPFYLFVSFTTPHGPLQPRVEDAERTAHIEKARRAKYAGLIVSLDDNIGKILDCLKESGLEDNTLVLFTNDNGGQTSTGANNFPLRGAKGQFFEGGVRVPWAIRLPGKKHAGAVVSQPVSALDILPTLVELAGAKVDPAWKLDGRSFYGNLLEPVQGEVERPLFWRSGGAKGDRAMRRGQWKLLHRRSKGLKPELFNLRTDIGETTDRSAEAAERVAAMIAELDAWEAPMKKPEWGPGSKP